MRHLPLLALALLAGCGPRTATPPTGDDDPAPKVGRPAPPVAFGEWLQGEPLSGLEPGKVTVLDFWASFCGPCRYMAPELSALSARYQAQGLAVVGITTDAPDVAAATRERWEMRYGVLSDNSGRTHQGYGISALPTIFIIDRRGVVRAVTVGAGRGEVDRVEALVKTLLAEAPPP